MKEIVLASNNEGKLKEMAALLPGYRLLTLRDIGFIQAIEEPFHTFRENAFTKAKTVFDFCGKPVLSDDSGICAAALDGRPGVDSAHFAGPQRSDADNRELLLQALQAAENRQAWYEAVLCLITADGTPHYFEGRCRGSIAPEARGSKGFGYDPVFIPEGFEQTFGELDESIKLKISHRAQALQALKQFLEQE